MIRSSVVVFFLFVACFCFASQQQNEEERPKIGLVLGGGGAKGAATIGALKVIEEVGLPIDFIAGTSVGAIIGGLYSCGYRAATLDSMFRSQEWLPLFVGGHVEELLDSMIAEKGFDIDTLNFTQLPIPFKCVATDIISQEEVVMNKGILSKALRASMAIPGVFSPVKWNGKTLVDGGMMNNLPVDIVKAMGADIVIAIDLQQTKHATRDFSLKDLLGIGGLLDWLVSRPDWRRYNENRQLADVCLNPKLGSYSSTSFNVNSIIAMMNRGEDCARQQIAALKKLKAKLQKR